MDLLQDPVDRHGVVNPLLLPLAGPLLLGLFAVGAKAGTALGRAPAAALLGQVADAGGDVLFRLGLGRLRHLVADWLDLRRCGVGDVGLGSGSTKRDEQPFYTPRRKIRNWKFGILDGNCDNCLCLKIPPTELGMDGEL